MSLFSYILITLFNSIQDTTPIKICFLELNFNDWIIMQLSGSSPFLARGHPRFLCLSLSSYFLS